MTDPLTLSVIVTLTAQTTTTTTRATARRTISPGRAASLALALLLVLVVCVGVATAPTTDARAQTGDNRQGQTRAETADRAGAPNTPAQTGALSPADRAAALAVVAPYGAPDAAADNAPVGASSRGPYDARDAAPDVTAVAAAERTSDDAPDAAPAGRYTRGRYSSGGYRSSERLKTHVAPTIGGYSGYDGGGGGDCGGGGYECGAYFFEVGTTLARARHAGARREACARLDHHFSAARTPRDASSRRRAASPPRARAQACASDATHAGPLVVLAALAHARAGRCSIDRGTHAHALFRASLLVARTRTDTRHVRSEPSVR